MALLFLESDKLSLSNEFILNKEILTDICLGAKHQLSPRAVVAILLFSSRNYGKWSKSCSLDGAETSELLAFLDKIGALEVHRKKLDQLKFLFIRMAWLVNGVKAIEPTYRRKATLSTILLATLRSTKLLWLSWLPLLVLAYGTGAFDFGRFAGITGFSLLAIITGIVIHEYSHVYVSYLRNTPSSVIQQGLRLGVLHLPLRKRDELISAIIGPVSGMLVSVLLGIAGTVVDPQLLTFGALAGALHIASWLPWYGDGMTITKLIRKEQNAYSPAN